MSSKREKELKYLIYLKAQLLKQTKKEIKELSKELEIEKSKIYVKKSKY